MTLKILDNEERLADAATEEILDLIQANPDALLCLATGSSPLRTYQQVVRKGLEKKIDFTKAHFIGLDEWVGIGPTNPGSCHYFLHQHIFKPLRIRESHIHLFNVMSGNLTRECEMMDNRIEEWNGIQLMVAGVGMNGHIGFNEPGTSPDLYSHVIQLDETTTRVGQKYFEGQTVLTEGITLGMKHFFNSGRVMMIAAGKTKSDVIAKAVNDEMSMALPATQIRKHKNSILLLDKEAATQLES
jgi:glucosamine-6-phosphate isomerase